MKTPSPPVDATPDPALDDRKAAIKAEFIAERGYWRPWTDTMLQVCPEFVAQYARYAGYPARNGPLSPRLVELIYIGLDASASHLFESGLNTHMKRALEMGASTADVFDVLHLVALQGIAQVGQAADILAECVGRAPGATQNTARQARMDRLGPSHALQLAALARLDPGYVDMLLDFVELGHPPQGLSPAERSLVLVAMHACFTAFNPGAVRQLITIALSQGVDEAALLQAIQLGAHLSVHGAALGADVFRSLASGA